jgi:hypothetical protein
MCKITISNLKKHFKMFKIANLHRNQRPTVNCHVKKIQNWIWNWEYNKFTRVTSTLVTIYFVENFLSLKFPKLNMKLRIQQIYKYNIHIGYDMFCWKLCLWLISFTRMNSSNFVFTYRNKSRLFEMWPPYPLRRRRRRRKIIKI